MQLVEKAFTALDSTQVLLMQIAVLNQRLAEIYGMSQSHAPSPSDSASTEQTTNKRPHVGSE
jgi:hypothetical protein